MNLLVGIHQGIIISKSANMSCRERWLPIRKVSIINKINTVLNIRYGEVLSLMLGIHQKVVLILVDVGHENSNNDDYNEETE